MIEFERVERPVSAGTFTRCTRLEELRLDFDTLHLEQLEALAKIAATPKLARAASDVRPFLEPAQDIELVDTETALRPSR